MSFIETKTNDDYWFDAIGTYSGPGELLDTLSKIDNNKCGCRSFIIEGFDGVSDKSLENYVNYNAPLSNTGTTSKASLQSPKESPLYNQPNSPTTIPTTPTTTTPNQPRHYDNNDEHRHRKRHSGYIRDYDYDDYYYYDEPYFIPVPIEIPYKVPVETKSYTHKNIINIILLFIIIALLVAFNVNLLK